MKDNSTKPTRRFGPGTVAMFIGIGAFALYSYMSKPSEPDRAYYESNDAGQLVRVDRPAVSSHKPPTLVKPDPKWLLDRSREMNLSKSQMASVEKIQAEWAVTRSQFESRFQAQARLISSRAKESSSTAQLQESLGDYSALSREFDRQRSEAWRRSTVLLSAAQRERLGELMEASK